MILAACDRFLAAFPGVGFLREPDLLPVRKRPFCRRITVRGNLRFRYDRLFEQLLVMGKQRSLQICYRVFNAAVIDGNAL